MHMMRNVAVLTQSLPKVPERHTVSMRVLYRDDRTPVRPIFPDTYRDSLYEERPSPDILTIISRECCTDGL